MKKHFPFLYCLFLSFSILFYSCSDKDEEAVVPDIQLSATDFSYKSTETNTKSFTLDVNTSWTATLTDSESNIAPNWLSISQTSGQAGSFDIKIKVSGQNQNKKLRETIIKFSAGELIKTVTVKQNGVATINIQTKEITIKGTESANIKFSVNDSWTITPTNISWGDLSKISGEAGEHTITFTPHKTNSSTENITLEGFINSDGASESFSIIHKADLEIYKDKEVVLLHTASKGIGVDLIFMGDGFTKQDLIKATGKYEKSIQQAIDYFFSIEPYKSYKEYFNVYMVVAESPEEGVNNESGSVNNKFSSTYVGGVSISFNIDLCREYVALIKDLKGAPLKFGDLTTIIILNSTKYAGGCWHWSDNFSISVLPMSANASPYDFKGLVNHEAGGHGFAMLADEYVNSGNRNLTIPQDKIEDGLKRRSWGRHFNVDFTNDLTQVQWKDFIGHPKYPMVGAYEGGLYYNYGVWRPEEGSCMINNIPYYNAPSRFAAIKRIMDINKLPFSFNDFVNTDVIDMDGLYIARTKRAIIDMPPLNPPVFVE